MKSATAWQMQNFKIGGDNKHDKDIDTGGQ